MCYDADVLHGDVVEVMRLLIDSGANVNARKMLPVDQIGIFQMFNAFIATQRKNREVIDWMENLFWTFPYTGESPLHYVCLIFGRANEWGGRADAVTLLLERGADADDVVETTLGVVPLHLATNCGLTAVSLALLAGGASVSLSNSKHEGPLHFAARAGDAAVVLELLRRGADPSSTTTEGCNVFGYAASCPYDEKCVIVADILGSVEHAADMIAANDWAVVGDLPVNKVFVDWLARRGIVVAGLAVEAPVHPWLGRGEGEEEEEPSDASTGYEDDDHSGSES